MLTKGQLMLKYENENFPQKDRRKAARRERRVKADLRRRKIIELPGYHPIVGGYRYCPAADPLTGRKIYIPDKRYIHYPKSSGGQQFLKKQCSKCIRRLDLEMLCGKGNRYRKFYEYQWALD